MGSRKQEKQKRKNSFATKMTLTAAVVTGVLGCVFTIFYKLGQTRLEQSAETAAPDAGMLGNEEDERIAKEKAELSTIQWQDNWVAIGDKVYSYDENQINLLILGLDKPGKMVMEPDYEKWEAGQTDAVFVVSLNSADNDVKIIGVPRNSMVDIDIYDSEDHIKETIYDQICLQYAFAGGGKPGLEKTREAVSELLYGLPIHGTVVIGYDAVSSVNDMVGGVDVVALESINSVYGNYKKGDILHLKGKFVLAYVKARNMQEFGSPTMRLERQKQYLTEFAVKIKNKVKQNPLLIKDMYTTVSDYMNTDVTLDKAIYLAAQAVDYRFSGNSIYLLQGVDKKVPVDEDNPDGAYYDDYYLDEENIKETMIEVFYQEVRLENEE